MSFARIAALVGRPGGVVEGLDDERLAEYVSHLLRRLPRPWNHTCLRRGVVLYHLLRRAGRPIELHIGVRKSDGNALEAHAWLVRSGAPYLEPNPASHRTFRVIAAFPEGVQVA